MLRRLRKGLEPSGVDLNLVDSKTMISPKDLPFKIEEIPSVFTSFRKVCLSPFPFPLALMSPV